MPDHRLNEHDAEYTSDWPTESPSNAPSTERTRTLEKEGFVRSEHHVLTDGQLGQETMTKGPEHSNPEGSVDINNKQYEERGDAQHPPEPYGT